MQRLFIAVILLGLLMSPMNFHMLWLADAFDSASEGKGLQQALAQGILLFASLVVVTDVFARTFDARSGPGQFCKVASVCGMVAIFIILFAASDAVKGQRVGPAWPQILVFSTAIVLSAFSAAIPTKNHYVGPGRLR